MAESQSPSGKGAGAGSGDSDFTVMLRETRERAARINRYVDMIPARFYLGTECQQVKDARSIVDPAKAKTTCQLIAEAALADVAKRTGNAEDSGGGAKSSSGDGRRRKERRKREGETSGGGESGGLADLSAGPEEDGDLANSRGELHAKLERRISELREERKRRQSNRDKANALRRATPTPELRRATPTPDKRAKPLESGSRPRPALNEDAELNFSFEPKQASLPFEAGVGRRGQKVQRLRADLRRSEADAAKLRKAEEAGDSKEVRKEIAMRKALQRAKGEKVHDDSQKLRKAQKKLELRKKKGKDAWKDRLADDKKQKEEKQEKRKENLAERRGKKKKAKGRSGFEGKQTGYLNS